MARDSNDEQIRKLERAKKRGDIQEGTADAEITRLQGLKSTIPPNAGISSRHSAGKGYISSQQKHEGGEGGGLVESAADIAIETAVIETAVGVALGETPGEAFAGAVLDEIVDTVFDDD